MLRFIGTILVIIASALLQGSLIPMIPYINTTPNLLLVTAFSIGIIRGKDEGLLYGLLCGLTLDGISGGLPGFYGLFYMYAGYLSGIFWQLFEVDIPVVPVVLTVICEMLYHGYVFVFKFLLRGRLGYGSYLQDIILPELFVTMLAAIILYGIISTCNSALEKIEQRSALKFV